MSARTLFLARLFGLYCLVIAPTMLSRPEAFVGIVHAIMADAPLALIAGVFTLFGGLALVLLHKAAARCDHDSQQADRGGHVGCRL